MITRHLLSTFADGSQALVTFWADGTVEVAKRDNVGDTWGPPARTEEWPS